MGFLLVDIEWPYGKNELCPGELICFYCAKIKIQQMNANIPLIRVAKMRIYKTTADNDRVECGSTFSQFHSKHNVR